MKLSLNWDIRKSLLKGKSKKKNTNFSFSFYSLANFFLMKIVFEASSTSLIPPMYFLAK